MLLDLRIVGRRSNHLQSLLQLALPNLRIPERLDDFPGALKTVRIQLGWFAVPFELLSGASQSGQGPVHSVLSAFAFNRIVSNALQQCFCQRNFFRTGQGIPQSHAFEFLDRRCLLTLPVLVLFRQLFRLAIKFIETFQFVAMQLVHVCRKGVERGAALAALADRRMQFQRRFELSLLDQRPRRFLDTTQQARQFRFLDSQVLVLARHLSQSLPFSLQDPFFVLTNKRTDVTPRAIEIESAA